MRLPYPRWPARMRGVAADDVAIIGAGIVGCAAAAFLAEGGARVTVYEAEHIGAAASGRNSGLVQHPLDARLVALYEESLEHHRATGVGRGPPSGFALVSEDAALVERLCSELGAACPELAPERTEPERGLAPGLAACVLGTGHPVAPAAATAAFAHRARAAGARIREGVSVAPAIAGGAATGVTLAGEVAAAGAVLVAAGPWSAALAGV